MGEEETTCLAGFLERVKFCCDFGNEFSDHCKGVKQDGAERSVWISFCFRLYGVIRFLTLSILRMRKYSLSES